MSGYFNLQRYGSSFRGAGQFDEGGERKVKNGVNPTQVPAGTTTMIDQQSDQPSLASTVTSTNSVAVVLRPVDGRKAWSIVFGSFLAHLAVLGNLYAFGIFVVPLSAEFGVSRADVSLVGTINIAFFYVAGIFAGPLADRLGVRPVMFAGICMWVLGCFLASITSALWQQILTQGVMVGLGSSCVYWPAISVVPQWFNIYRGTAVGMAALGAGIGNLIFALGGQAIIQTLGWRNTLRVLGGAGGGLLLLALILVERRAPPRKGGGLFDVAKQLIKLGGYRWFLLATFLFQWGFFVPFVHIAAYTKDLGIEATYQGLA
jgi:MFS family permease